jgi:hypothetical protein
VKVYIKLCLIVYIVLPGFGKHLPVLNHYSFTLIIETNVKAIPALIRFVLEFKVNRPPRPNKRPPKQNCKDAFSRDPQHNFRHDGSYIAFRSEAAVEESCD